MERAITEQLTSERRSGRRARALGVLLSLTMVHGVLAQAPPFLQQVRDSAVVESTEVNPATDLMLGELRVTFEQSTLDEVSVELLRGSVRYTVGAGGSLYWLCYSSTVSQPKQRLWILSDGELGGPDHSVTGIQASLLESRERATVECPELPRQYARITLRAVGWLGDSHEALQKAFGGARATEGWVGYRFQGVAISGRDSQLDVLAYLDVKLRNGRIAALAMRSTTTD